MVSVAVVRRRGININSSVHYYTRDDSALASQHYYETIGVLHFAAGEQRKVVDIQICTYYPPTNQTTRFFVHIVEDDNCRVIEPSGIEVLIVGREPVVPFFHKEPHVVFSETITSHLQYGMVGRKSLVCITVSCGTDVCMHLLFSYTVM